MKQRKRPLSSGRPFSPIQTGQITKTMPNPMAVGRQHNARHQCQWYERGLGSSPLTRRPARNALQSLEPICTPMPAAVSMQPTKTVHFLPMRSMIKPEMRMPTASPPVETADHADWT